MQIPKLQTPADPTRGSVACWLNGFVGKMVLKRVTRLPLDVHLMIVQPERYIDAFAHVFRETGAQFFNGRDEIFFVVLIFGIQELISDPAVVCQNNESM